MTIANIGSCHSQVFALVAMYMDDWTDLGHSIFKGDVVAFSSYLQVDLSEER
jgi:hypothetical protein